MNDAFLVILGSGFGTVEVEIFEIALYFLSLIKNSPDSVEIDFKILSKATKST